MTLSSRLIAVGLVLLIAISSSPIHPENLSVVAAQETQNRESIFFLTKSSEGSLIDQGDITLWEFNPHTDTVEVRAQRPTPTTSVRDSGIPPEELALIVEHHIATEEELTRIVDRRALHFIDKIVLSSDRERLLYVERVASCHERGRFCYGIYRLWLDDFQDNQVAPQEILAEFSIHLLSGQFTCDLARGTLFGGARVFSVEWSPDENYILLGITCGTLDVFPFYHVIDVNDHSVREIGRSKYMTWTSDANELAKVSNESCTDAEFSAATCFMEFQIIAIDAPETPLYTVKTDNLWFFDTIMRWIPGTDAIGILGMVTSQEVIELRIYNRKDSFQSYEVAPLEKQFDDDIMWSNDADHSLMAGVRSRAGGVYISIYNSDFNELANFEIEISSRKVFWGTDNQFLWLYSNTTEEHTFFNGANHEVRTVNLMTLVDANLDDPFDAIIATAY